MTANDFNDKYDEYLETGHYGLAIGDEQVIEFLDRLFEDLIKIEGFSYSQIKLKFGMARFYANGINSTTSNMIEQKIDNILKGKL